MKPLNRNSVKLPRRPVKIIQFGGGNFLRGFVDWMVDLMNEKTEFNGNIQLVKLLPQGSVEIFNRQDGLFHVFLQGIANGKTIQKSRLISCVQGMVNPYTELDAFLALAENPDLQFVISNTTESGIAFDREDTLQERNCPKSFPGKLTFFLYHRFNYFQGNSAKGLTLLPCELIENNGVQLRAYVLQYARYWGLSQNFVTWMEKSCHFYNTLVDRIVPGFPKDNVQEIQEKLGFQDQLIVTAEPFHLWVIEGPEELERIFPAPQAGLQVKFVKDINPYRMKKVRILNGAHTAMVPIAYLAGIRTVREAVEDKQIVKIIQAIIFDEIIPSLGFPKDELEKFAFDVLDRFRNPFVRHELISIALNSVSKFKGRVLPSILEYHEKTGTWPKYLMHSFAAMIQFYSGKTQGENIPLKDDASVLEFFKEIWKGKDLGKIVKLTLQNETFWGLDLSRLPGFHNQVLTELKYLQKTSKYLIEKPFGDK